MEGALGIIEIRGLATAVMVADVMVKTATVKIVNIEKAKGFGWITVKISGNVAAVNASIDAGKQIGEAHGNFISSKVIPRPSVAVANLFCNGKDEGKVSTAPVLEEKAGTGDAEIVNEPVPLLKIEIDIVKESDLSLKTQEENTKDPLETMAEVTKDLLPPAEKRIEAIKGFETKVEEEQYTENQENPNIVPNKKPTTTKQNKKK